MSQVGGATNTSSVSFQSVSGMRSPQMALAMLMMKLSEANKESAMTGIKEIEAEQAEKTKMANALNMARECKSNHNYINNWGYADNIPTDLKDVASKNGIRLPNWQDVDGKKPGPCDTKKNEACWDKVIAQLQTKMDTVGANLQTKMVQLQDMMGQYNSYLQGANSAIAKSNEVLSALAQGR